MGTSARRPRPTTIDVPPSKARAAIHDLARIAIRLLPQGVAHPILGPAGRDWAVASPAHRGAVGVRCARRSQGVPATILRGPTRMRFPGGRGSVRAGPRAARTEPRPPDLVNKLGSLRNACT